MGTSSKPVHSTKENTMFTNRFTKIVAVIIILTLALTTASMISAGPTAGNAVESKEKALREYHLGERYGVTPQDTANIVDLSASDFYQRHPDWTWTVRDASVVIPVTGESAYPDYFQRHPELIARGGASVDMTDYYFRQKVLKSTVKAVDLTDYYFRHPGQ
jgi:hypothetical protein